MSGSHAPRPVSNAQKMLHPAKRDIFLFIFSSAESEVQLIATADFQSIKTNWTVGGDQNTWCGLVV